MRIYKYIFYIIVPIQLLVSCQSEYTKTVKKELAKKAQNDSLIFGTYFGDTKKQFFTKCWELNKKGLVIQSIDNNYVAHTLKSKDTLTEADDIEMLFYGRFNEENIMDGMDFKFRFKGWTLWNEQFQSPVLIEQVKDSIESWFPGNSFFKVRFPEERLDIHVKIDGNRQFKMYTTDNREVIVIAEDLYRSK